jgi:hypothetical protein
VLQDKIAKRKPLHTQLATFLKAYTKSNTIVASQVKTFECQIIHLFPRFHIESLNFSGIIF